MFSNTFFNWNCFLVVNGTRASRASHTSVITSFLLKLLLAILTMTVAPVLRWTKVELQALLISFTMSFLRFTGTGWRLEMKNFLPSVAGSSGMMRSSYLSREKKRNDLDCTCWLWLPRIVEVRRAFFLSEVFVDRSMVHTVAFVSPYRHKQVVGCEKLPSVSELPVVFPELHVTHHLLDVLYGGLLQFLLVCLNTCTAATAGHFVSTEAKGINFG